MSVTFADERINVTLADGRVASAPIAWFPRLTHATEDERNDLRWIANGTGIHWPQLDEDISVAALLAGRPSMESQASLERWLATRS